MSILSFEKINARLDRVLKIVKTEHITPDQPIEIDKVVRIATGTTIIGLLTCPDNCFFDGIMNGDLEVGNKLVLSENSEVYGSIYAGNLMVKGKVDAKVKVADKAVCCSTSIVTAKSLQTHFLVVENGAVLNLSHLAMQLNDAFMPEVAPMGIENNSTTENKASDKESTIKADLKVKNEAKHMNQTYNDTSDDTLLFQFFHNEEDE